MPKGCIAAVRLVFALAVMPLASGCLAAAAGAGAAAGIYLTDQGAQSVVNGSVSTVDVRTRAVLSEMGVQVNERREKSDGFEYRGTRGDLEVRVELESQGANTTMMKTSARKNLVEWDKSYARSIIERVVRRG